jgi:hypothetical protein
MAGVDLGVVAAAAAPATTTDRAKMRMASFIVGYPLQNRIDRRGVSRTLES